MPEYLSPGVYIEEIEIGPRPIEGVGTSTAGFLGETLRGPLEPRLVTGFEQFKRLYGGYYPSTSPRCPSPWTASSRTADSAASSARIAADRRGDHAGDHDGKMQIKAIGPGTWGNRIAAKIESGQPAGSEPAARTVQTDRHVLGHPPPVDPPIDPTDPD